VANRAVLGPLDRCGASGSEVAAVGADFEHATSSVTPDATSKDEGGLHPPRRGLASWLGDMRERVQLDPRRWTAVGSLAVASSFPPIAGCDPLGPVVGSKLIVKGNDDAF
jgi:hypothetical protein